MADQARSSPKTSRPSCPTLHVSLSRVGVTNVEKVIRIGANGTEQLFSAKLDCFVDLGPRQKGAHMSRFEEVVNEAIGEVILGESAFRAETLAAAHRRAASASARARAAPRSRSRRATPSTSRRPCRGSRRRRSTRCSAPPSPPSRHAPADRRRRPGHDRLPVRAGRSCRRARASGCSTDGFDEDEIERIFEAVPVATHNQRGLGTLHIGCPEDCDDRHRRRAAARRSSRTRCRRRSTS